MAQRQRIRIHGFAGNPNGKGTVAFVQFSDTLCRHTIHKDEEAYIYGISGGGLPPEERQSL